MMRQSAILTLMFGGLCMGLCARAQHIETNDTLKTPNAVQTALLRTQEALVRFDTEQLDSIDQERLPRIATLGVMAAPNISSFFIAQDGEETMSSHMRIGCDMGGFIDFAITKHFAIQAQLLFTAEQNRFGVTNQEDRMWSFGVDIPVYFMGRIGSQKKGYASFGGGIYTHATFLSNIGGRYSNNGAATSIESKVAGNGKIPVDDNYALLNKLHQFHSGVCATAIYEFPVGVQIFASFKFSLTDILAFYQENEGQPATNASIYPQKVNLGVAYRFRTKPQHKHRVVEGKDQL